MGNKKFWYLLAGAVLFNIIFWKESLGLNIAIFHLFLLNGMFWFFRGKIKNSQPALFTLAGSTLAAILLLIHGTTLAKFSYIFSTLFFIAYLHQPKLRSFIFAGPSAITNFVLFPKQLFEEVNFLKNEADQRQSNKFWRIVKLSLLPLLFLFIFYWIFKFANPVFDKLSDDFFSAINDWIVKVFGEISFARVWLFILGFILLGWACFNAGFNQFAKSESGFNDQIIRRRFPRRTLHPYQQRKVRPLKMGLKNEHITGIILVVMLNILLLIVNIIDISWVWIGFEYTDEENLSQFVHEGTYLLILSILLSMGIMLFFYRRNQNFYPKSTLLKPLTYAWIGQNIVLTLSVAMRNYHYINYYGLAYKRLALIGFLAMVLFGLVTLFLKIKDKKSGYFLFRLNSWGIYFIIIAFTFFNWDKIIINYNLNKESNVPVDTYFLLKLSDKTLPVLHKNQHILDKADDQIRDSRNYYPDTFREYYEKRVHEFMIEKADETIMSWNLPQNQAYEFYKNLSSSKAYPFDVKTAKKYRYLKNE